VESDGGAMCADRRLIVQRTRVVQPSPRVEATRGQSQEPQQCPQRHKVTDKIHASQDPHLVASVGQTLVRQGESRASKYGEVANVPADRRSRLTSAH